MDWINTHIKLGEIKPGIKQTIIFKPKDNLKEVRSLTSSCGCGVPKLKDGNIIVIYIPGQIPMHLRNLGIYNTTKTITVNYKDGTVDKLKFSATVKK